MASATPSAAAFRKAEAQADGDDTTPNICTCIRLSFTGSLDPGRLHKKRKPDASDNGTRTRWNILTMSALTQL